MDSKLKPCPHCGSVAVHSYDEQDGRDYICCLGCTARVSARGIEAAENIWNKRVVLAQEVDAPAGADPFAPTADEWEAIALLLEAEQYIVGVTERDERIYSHAAATVAAMLKRVPQSIWASGQ